MREVPKSNQIKASVCTRILLILLLCKSLVSIKIHPDSISGQQDVITTKILYTYLSDLGEAYYVSGSYSSKIQEEEMERAGGGGGGGGIYDLRTLYVIKWVLPLRVMINFMNLISCSFLSVDFLLNLRAEGDQTSKSTSIDRRKSIVQACTK